MPLFEARGLNVSAAGKLLLRGFELALEAGERVVLRGRSGLGKSTLLRSLNRLEDPAAGEVLLEGRAPEDWGWPEFRRRVVLLTQTPSMPEGSVDEALAAPFAYASATGEFPDEPAGALLARLGLPEEARSQAARSLSVGEQQRVALVRALLLEPRVLLLDEPTSALDEDSTGAVEELLAEQAGAGLAMVVVSHDKAQASRLGDREVDLGELVPGGGGEG